MGKPEHLVAFFDKEHLKVEFCITTEPLDIPWIAESVLPLKELSSEEANTLSPEQAVKKYEKEIRATLMKGIKEETVKLLVIQQQISKEILVLSRFNVQIT